jgi:trans-aconitate methyltransferase
MTQSCRYCGSTDIQKVPDFAALCRVTSDSKPWPSGGTLLSCRGCGGVQKPGDQKWQQETAAIYAAYTMFHQSGCTDQPVFDESTGLSMPRTERLVRQIIAEGGGLDESGRALDVGCGQGAMLEAMGRLRPSWELHGHEQTDSVRGAIEALPGVARFHSGPVEAITQRFDLISLTHVLEHVPEPAAFLRLLAGKLSPGGRVLIEVPNAAANPFDLLIADHCNHFTADGLEAVVRESGLEPVLVTDRFIRRELTLIASVSPATVWRDVAVAAFDAGDHVGWLRLVAAEAAECAANEGCGVFGTSIAGIWLSATLGAGARFFVDEDPYRAGHRLFGRSVHFPAEVPTPSRVFVPINGPSAGAIAARIARPGVLYRGPSTSV